MFLHLKHVFALLRNTAPIDLRLQGEKIYQSNNKDTIQFSDKKDPHK